MPDETAPKPSDTPQKDDFVARVIDALLDLLETARDWVQQEAEATVREKIVYPLQRLGLTLASAAAAAALLVIALIFIAVAAVIFFGSRFGYDVTFLGIGVLFLLGSGTFLLIKVRSIQK